MTHYIHKYITKRLIELDWQDKLLVEKSGISKGQISKLKNGLVEKLSAETFYQLIIAFGDDFQNAILIVYPHLSKVKLKKYKSKERNIFGSVMKEYEVSINSIEEISIKTGIPEIRLSELYFRNGALEAFELILIERAIEKTAGYLFEKLYGNK